MSSEKPISGSEINFHLKKLVANERQLTQEILTVVNQIEQRKIFLSLGYATLFDYLAREIGYSSSAAMRRIDAARLIRELPQLSHQIENGKVNLTQVNLIQRTIRDIEKHTFTKVNAIQKAKLLKDVEGFTTTQTQIHLAKAFDLNPPKKEFSAKYHQDSSQTLSLHFTSIELTVLNQACDLVTHALGRRSIKDSVLYLAKKEIHSRTGTPASKVTRPVAVAAIELDTTTDLDSAWDKASKREPAVTNLNIEPDTEKSMSLFQAKKMLLKPGASCQFVSSETGVKCGSTAFLTIEHIQPRWAGGTNELSNLTVLCKAHNQLQYKSQAGIRPV